MRVFCPCESRRGHALASGSGAWRDRPWWRKAPHGFALTLGVAPGNLEPPVLAAEVGHRVTFVNRSGRSVHVEFHRETGGHCVFQVPGEIWAEFHRPGRHGYVVHFFARGQADLHGAVEVRAIEGRVYPHTCDGLTVMGECYAP